jgi:hypothetical protein
MRLYKVYFPRAEPPYPQNEAPSWHGTHRAAVAKRIALMEDYELLRKEVEIDEVNVPTRKSDLIAWLNKGGLDGQ